MVSLGRRAVLVQYFPLYWPDVRCRHEVVPGMSGWAQVNGRNNISWTKKFELDVWYVEHCSLLLDIKILFMTVMKVLKRADINKDGFVVTEPFNGHN